MGLMNETGVGSRHVVDWKEKEGDTEGEVVVIPGLWDGHAHLLQLGEVLEGVKLYGMGSVEGNSAPGTMNEAYFINNLHPSYRSPHYSRNSPQHQPHTRHEGKLATGLRLGSIPPLPRRKKSTHAHL